MLCYVIDHYRFVSMRRQKSCLIRTQLKANATVLSRSKQSHFDFFKNPIALQASYRFVLVPTTSYLHVLHFVSVPLG